MSEPFAEALADLVDRYLVPCLNSKEIIRDLEFQILTVRDRRDDEEEKQPKGSIAS